MVSLLLCQVNGQPFIQFLYLLRNSTGLLCSFAEKDMLFGCLEDKSDDEVHADTHKVAVSLRLTRLHQGEFEDMSTH